MMTLKKPSFWANSPHLMDRFTAYVLWPFSMIYRMGYALHAWRHRSNFTPHSDDVTVICIGNLTVGGTGKTPVVIAIYDQLKRQNQSPVILSKGYGGSITSPCYANPQIHDATQIGDEALMMAKSGHNVIISHSRKNGLQFAQTQGHKTIIMDDGMQNVHIKADINLCIVDGFYGFGNGFCLPAGPLRQSLSSAFPRIDAFLVNRDASPALQSILDTSDKPLFRTKFTLDEISKDQDYYAFAGIGDPQKLYESLCAAGLNIIATTDFPDHHVYSTSDIDTFRAKAKSLNARLITTEKDAVKLRECEDIVIAKGHLDFVDNQAFVDFLNTLKAAKSEALS